MQGNGINKCTGEGTFCESLVQWLAIFSAGWQTSTNTWETIWITKRWPQFTPFFFGGWKGNHYQRVKLSLPRWQNGYHSRLVRGGGEVVGSNPIKGPLFSDRIDLHSSDKLPSDFVPARVGRVVIEKWSSCWKYIACSVHVCEVSCMAGKSAKKKVLI